ncbi:hypothetical protein [Eleftheria terrae]|uniref:hypothetical protein n=1 Tax=Eleftheria terrae TaxID=1597781 RepID=UPI00263A9ECF|nr:hypothetical protein [Eleftheria terrae]WKB56134.1 hypothetical protein N7L95_29270 [Eleftheria terrae]
MDLLGDLIETFEGKGSIPLAKVHEWLNAEDIEVCGAAYAYFERLDCVERIEPRLTHDEFDVFVLRYLQRCIVEGGHHDWAHSRYEAAWALASWFTLTFSKDARNDRLKELRLWLERTYLDRADLRSVIINGFLEHVVSHRGMAEFFKGWRCNTELAAALRRAKEWQASSGNSPLG